MPTWAPNWPSGMKSIQCQRRIITHESKGDVPTGQTSSAEAGPSRTKAVTGGSNGEWAASAPWEAEPGQMTAVTGGSNGEWAASAPWTARPAQMTAVTGGRTTDQ